VVKNPWSIQEPWDTLNAGLRHIVCRLCDVCVTFYARGLRMSDQWSQQDPSQNTSRRRRGRSSRQEVGDRRREVFQLRQMGYTAKEIGERLMVSERTVLRDLDSIGQEVTASLQNKIDDVVLDAFLRYETLHQRSFAEHVRAKPGSTQSVQALQAALGALASQHRFMKSCRLFPKGGLLDLDAGDGK